MLTENFEDARASPFNSQFLISLPHFSINNSPLINNNSNPPLHTIISIKVHPILIARHCETNHRYTFHVWSGIRPISSISIRNKRRGLNDVKSESVFRRFLISPRCGTRSTIQRFLDYSLSSRISKSIFHNVWKTRITTYNVITLVTFAFWN